MTEPEEEFVNKICTLILLLILGGATACTGSTGTTPTTETSAVTSTDTTDPAVPDENAKQWELRRTAISKLMKEGGVRTTEEPYSYIDVTSDGDLATTIFISDGSDSMSVYFDDYVHILYSVKGVEYTTLTCTDRGDSDYCADDYTTSANRLTQTLALFDGYATLAFGSKYQV